MTEDANWVGVTPKPPALCDRTANCSATVHQIGCDRAKAKATRRAATDEDRAKHLQACNNYGHRLLTLYDAQEPVMLVCQQCQQNWDVAPR